ncbi:hypothetical protein CEXT_746031 [Caerostris extrusa]|uniref:Maturase K n=1 Tax=Caerostris extrusa TaxID=172846 RepID=A0AAV4VVZ5_CAEEX|nr:hypothetical protein CEXT_746031 [Caerostris extrusa]
MASFPRYLGEELLIKLMDYGERKWWSRSTDYPFIFFKDSELLRNCIAVKALVLLTVRRENMVLLGLWGKCIERGSWILKSGEGSRKLLVLNFLIRKQTHKNSRLVEKRQHEEIGEVFQADALHAGCCEGNFQYLYPFPSLCTPVLFVFGGEFFEASPSCLTGPIAQRKKKVFHLQNFTTLRRFPAATRETGSHLRFDFSGMLFYMPGTECFGVRGRQTSSVRLLPGLDFASLDKI